MRCESFHISKKWSNLICTEIEAEKKNQNRIWPTWLPNLFLVMTYKENENICLHIGLKDETVHSSYLFALRVERKPIFLYTCNQFRTSDGKL